MKGSLWHRYVVPTTPLQWIMVIGILAGVVFAIYCNSYRISWLRTADVQNTSASSSSAEESSTPEMYSDLEKRLQNIRQKNH